MIVGTLTLNRFNGQEQFAISEATIWLFDDDDCFKLNFEIETNKKPIKTLPDTQGSPTQPNAEFTVRLPEFSWENLVGQEFEIPEGYDEEGEFLARFYYYEHEGTDNNLIKVIEKDGARYRVLLEATCTDVNWYDGSKPATKLEIDAWFTPHKPFSINPPFFKSVSKPVS